MNPTNNRPPQPPPHGVPPTLPAATGPERTAPTVLTDEQKDWLGRASRRDIGGWLHITVSGAPFARGFQYGYLVADEYADSIRVYREMTYQDIGMSYDFFVGKAVELHGEKIPAELRAEMEGVAAGLTAAGVASTFDDVLGVNDWMELTGYWWPKNSGRYTALAPTGGEGNHCSAFIATGSATVDGRIVLGHTSFTDFWQGQFENIILDLTPEEGNRMVMQTAPGWVASMTDFWLSSAGLAVTETTIGGYEGFKGYDETRTPEFCRARIATQYADSIDSWISQLNADNNGGYANSWLIGDINTNEIARYEEGLLYQSLSRTSDGYFWGDNAPTDPRIRNLECIGTGFSDIRTPNGARQVRWRQLLEQFDGKIDAAVGKRMIADTFDPYLNYTHPSSRTICAHSDEDRCELSGLTPFTPFGSIDAKVATSADIAEMRLWARFGRADGAAFDAEEFLRQHPQWDWQRGYLKSRPQQPWTYLTSENGNG